MFILYSITQTVPSFHIDKKIGSGSPWWPSGGRGLLLIDGGKLVKRFAFSQERVYNKAGGITTSQNRQ
jgi:hypothetical protein